MKNVVVMEHEPITTSRVCWSNGSPQVPTGWYVVTGGSPGTWGKYVAGPFKTVREASEGVKK